MGIKVSMELIPSEKNPADELSRIPKELKVSRDELPDLDLDVDHPSLAKITDFEAINCEKVCLAHNLQNVETDKRKFNLVVRRLLRKCENIKTRNAATSLTKLLGEEQISSGAFRAQHAEDGRTLITTNKLIHGIHRHEGQEKLETLLRSIIVFKPFSRV
jgi:hypothetical protein